MVFHLHYTIELNAPSTFELSKAEVSIKTTSFFLLYYSTSEVSTLRYSSAKSLLLPTRRMTMPGGPLDLSSVIQVSTFRKLLLFVIS